MPRDGTVPSRPPKPPRPTREDFLIHQRDRMAASSLNLEWEVFQAKQGLEDAQERIAELEGQLAATLAKIDPALVEPGTEGDV